MLYTLLAPMEAVKRWAEMWQHRLQGHMVVTRPDALGSLLLSQSYWAEAIYTEGGTWKADLCSGETIILSDDRETYVEGA